MWDTLRKDPETINTLTKESPASGHFRGRVFWARGRCLSYQPTTCPMATIAEIIAAKKAGATAAPAKPAPVTTSAPKESLADKLEAKAAIDRIDPPGKSERAASARKSAGLILSKELPNGPEARGQATPIAGPPERRSLSETAGEAFPMLPTGADDETATWHEAMSAFESDLVVMRDAVEPEVCWLAVRPLRPGLPPILLHRLPWVIWEHPATPTKGGEPF